MYQLSGFLATAEAMDLPLQILLQRAAEDYPKSSPPPLRFIRSCSSSLAAPTLHKLEAAFKVPVLEVCAHAETGTSLTSLHTQPQSAYLGLLWDVPEHLYQLSCSGLEVFLRSVQHGQMCGTSGVA